MKIVLQTLLATIAGYSVAYFLSSGEILFDIKNILLLFVITGVWFWFFHSFPKARKPVAVLFCIAVLSGYGLAGIGYVTEPFTIYRMFKDILYCLTLPAVAFSVYRLTENPAVTNLTALVITALMTAYAAFVSVMLGFYSVFHAKFGSNSLTALLNTNLQEAKEFIASYSSPGQAAAFVLLLCAFACFVFRQFLNAGKQMRCYPAATGKNLKKALAFSLALILGCYMFGAKTYAAITMETARYASKRQESFAKNSKARIQKIGRLKDAGKHKYRGNIALVIGETHVRSHMHAYGYERQTTPFLDKAIQNGTVFPAPRSFSCAAQTDTALPMVVTEKSQYNKIAFKDTATIVEMAHHGGYRVVWISNQQKSDIIGVIADTADETVWINTKTNDTYLRQKNGAFDEHVLTALHKQEKPRQKTLYVIHLLGSHANYDCRYPDTFKKWDDTAGSRTEQLVNSYDNSVLYTDYVLAEIQKTLFGKLDVSAFLYVSDHGEELHEYFCHGEDFFISRYKESPYMADIVKVPFFLAVSPGFRSKYPEIIANWKKNSNKFFTNDMIYDTILGLMDIRCQHYNARQDYTSDRFGFPPGKMRTGRGKVRLEEVAK